MPSEFWLLHCFFITLRNQNRHFLVLEYPSYARSCAGSLTIRDCIWSVPYIAYKLDPGPRKCTLVSDIRDLFSSFANAHDDEIERRIQYKFYHMGVSYHPTKQLPDLLEVKRSPREPDVWKCYYVRRYLISDLDVLGRSNIVDPEGLMPYRYLCLDESDSVLEVPYPGSPYHQLFRGKPLSTNVAFTFLNNEVEHLKDKAIDVVDGDFYHNDEGFILSFDLAAFGEFFYSIEQTLRTFDQTGKEIADDFLTYLEHEFRSELDKYRYHQHSIAGDGFVASSPVRHFALETGIADIDMLTNQIVRTLDVVKVICARVNARIQSEGTRLDSRCVLTYERFLYGKRGGFYSESASHAGRALIRLARIEEALRKWYSLRAEDRGSGQVFLAVEPALFEQYEGLWEDCGFTLLEEFPSQEKETHLTLKVLVAQPSGEGGM